MTWTTIRLELASTPDFPAGSASRAYLLRLPLRKDGLIDADRLAETPRRATVRRFWPSQPDLTGTVIRTRGGWALRYTQDGDDDEPVFHLETHRLRLGGYITLTEPDGQKLPFRIASMSLVH